MKTVEEILQEIDRCLKTLELNSEGRHLPPKEISGFLRSLRDFITAPSEECEHIPDLRFVVMDCNPPIYVCKKCGKNYCES